MAITQVSASGSLSLDQAADTVIDTMTVTPAVATYLCVFSATIISYSTPVDNDTVFYSFYGAGSQVSGTELYYVEDNSFTNSEHVIAGAAVITVNGSEAIDVRYRVTATGRPFTMTHRALTIMPVDPADVTVITDLVDDTLASATYTVMDSMTSTPAAGDYLALFHTTVEMDTDNALTAVAVHVGGTILQHTERTMLREQSYNQFGAPLLIACKVSPNGSEAVDVRWQRQAGSGTLTAKQRQLILIAMASTDILESSGVSDFQASSTSPETISGLSLTTPAAADWLAIWGLTDFIASGGSFFTYGVYVDAVLAGPSTRINDHEGSLDNADVWIAAHEAVSLNGTQSVDVRWNGSSTSTRTVHERTLVLVREVVTPVSVPSLIFARRDRRVLPAL